MAFLELRTPQDMLAKAEREYGRLKADFNIDNLFNYFVTVNHIRDYVLKTESVDQVEMDNFFTDQDMKDCRDLCDKAKHLRLTKRPDPMTHKWSGCIGGAPIGALPIGGDGEWELWSNSRAVNIEKLADRVLEKWKDFFERHQL
ncbi:MAG: hypothetical protein P9E88_11530 [Candidatus Competibacter sp.]|jgi:hypothetical protein|nr:hypothetical protein [Candidatus Competibacter sp.]